MPRKNNSSEMTHDDWVRLTRQLQNQHNWMKRWINILSQAGITPETQKPFPIDWQQMADLILPEAQRNRRFSVEDLDRFVIQYAMKNGSNNNPEQKPTQKKPATKRGAPTPSDTNIDADRKLAEQWNEASANGCHTYEEFAASRQWTKTGNDIRQAIDRHRKRERKT